MYRLLICLSIILLGAPSLRSQQLLLPAAPIQEYITGKAGQDEILSAAVNWRGDLATIGNTNRGDQGGKDICLTIYNAQLSKVLERHIGRQADDGAGQIAVLPDGRYLIAGYSSRPAAKYKTRSSYYGKKDGWLLIVNENGETEKEMLLGTSEEDVFTSVAVHTDGTVWLVGNSGSKVWLVRLNSNLELLWERRIQYHQLATNAVAAAINPEGMLFVTGGIVELDRKHLWVAAYDTSGQAVMEKIYPTSQAESGTGICIIHPDRLAITGKISDPRNRENGFISLLDQKGIILNYKPLGGSEFDLVNTLIRVHTGLLAGGASASFERGSRRTSGWVTSLDVNGKPLQEKYYGSKLDDAISSFVMHPDGRLFAVGTTAKQVLKMRQGWVLQLSAMSVSSAAPDALSARIPSVAYAPQINTAASTVRAFLPFFIENKDTTTHFRLRAVIQSRKNTASNIDNQAAFNPYTVQLPPVHARSSYHWGLPLHPVQKNLAGRYPLEVQFFQGNTPIGPPQPFEINIGLTDQPQLEISVATPDSVLTPGQKTSLQITLKNAGTKPAKDINITILAPSGLEVPAQLQLGNLAAGEKRVYPLTILPKNTIIPSDQARLLFRASDGSLLYTTTTEITIPISQRPSDKTYPVANNSNYAVAVWVYPNPDNFEQKEIIWTQDEMTVQIKIVSSQPIHRRQFCLHINGEPCPEGAKFEEVQIKGDTKSKTFSQTIKLREGENILRAELTNGTQSFSSEPLKIIYSPSKPNLHIIAIGVPSDDLKYTRKDARDFAAALANAKNNAFGSIFLDTLVSESRTTKTEILKAFKRLQYRYTDLQIQPHDLLIVFVSGHGISAYDGSFRLAASDFDSPFLQETSLDFEQELVNYLQSLPCKKLFLVDACHSGTTSGNGLAGMATRKNTLNMMVSCQSDELSYEDDNWQNGAFTRALVKGIDAFVEQPAAMDLNRDKALDVQELFDFIQKEVPQLVEKKRPKTKTGQRPHLVLANALRPVILFELK